MAPPRKNKLPKPLPDGFILTDSEKKKWRLGKIIGQGGFGLIYLASQNVDRPVGADTDFVIKLEYQENGPLFSELKFYQRAAKPESMQKWMRNRRLDFLGIPTYWGSGLAEYKDLRYRFMVMDRLGRDLQKVWEDEGQPEKATVLQLGQRLVDILEYIHENEYVHADIKAANLMNGHRDPEMVYLADYGLSYRYCPDGVHKEYKENPKKGHNGTIEYTSLDAHKGTGDYGGFDTFLEILVCSVCPYLPAPSRRGDLQVLGFCLLHWLCGSLPWDSVLKNPAQVQEAKTRLMDNLPHSVQQLSVSGASTDEMAEFLLYVKTLDYQDKPDYQLLKDLLTVIRGRLDVSTPKGPAGKSSTKTEDPPTRKKQKVERAGGSSKAKPLATVVDEEVAEGTKSKPVPARQRSGPPVTKSHPQTEEVLPAVRRSLRPRPEPVRTYEEDSEDEEESEDEDEEKARPRPIPACYLRGPPIGPRPQSKQKTESKRTSRKRDSRSVAPASQEPGLHPQRTKHVFPDCGSETQTHMDCRERWDGRLHNHRADHSHQPWGAIGVCYEHRDSSGDWERPGQEAGSTQTKGLLHWSVFVGISLVLGAWVLGVFSRKMKF